MTQRLATVILAAGQGTRMRSCRVKVLHPLAGQPMLFHLLETARKIGSARVAVVIGHGAEAVREALAGQKAEIVLQREQRGTAHAVLQTRPLLGRFRGTIVIVNGDAPLLTAATVGRLVKAHRERGAAVSLLTADLAQPRGYGRIIRDAEEKVLRVVEEKDATAEERNLTEVSAGVYCVEPRYLYEALEGVVPDNAQKEYYLPDLVGAAARKGWKVETLPAAAPEEVLGINTRIDLARAEQVLRRRIVERLMLEGVTVLSPETTFVDSAVRVGQDSILYPYTFLEGKTEIGEECTIYPYCRIQNSALGRGVVIKEASVLTDCRVGNGSMVGPFAHLRPGTVLGEGVRIGNFVEVKQSTIGDGTKASHLSYLGDAVLGKGINIGAGTITCNFDGKEKHRTVIEDEVFVGSDTQFIAPVRVGKGALIAAGSTIVEDVPAEALAISRAPQVNKPGWVRQRGGERKDPRGKEKEDAKADRRVPMEFDALLSLTLVERFERLAKSYEAAFFQQLGALLEKTLADPERKKVEEFIEFTRRLSGVYQNLAVPDLLRRVLDETRFLQWLRKEKKGPLTDQWLQEIQDLLGGTQKKRET